jgi:hypothetical protein
MLSTTGTNPNETYVGTMVVEGNTQVGGTLQQFINQEAWQGSAGQYNLIVKDNVTTSDSSAFVVFFGGAANFGDILGEVTVEGNSLANTGGKGVVGLDASSLIPFRSSPLTVHVPAPNTLSSTTWASNWAEAPGSSGNTVGYRTTTISPPSVAQDTVSPAIPPEPITPSPSPSFEYILTPGYASTPVPGVIQLATDAEVQAGVEATHAVTPASLQSKLSDSISTTSSTTIASSTAVKTAYDAAIAAATALGPLTSDTVLYVNCTDGNDTTAARGTDRPFATVAAAIAAASEGDTIFLSAGTFTENFTINKGIHLCGTYTDQATWSGTKILGNVIVSLVGGGVIRNLAVSDIYFISANSTSPVSITGMSPGAGGINTFTNCTFTQANVSDTAQFAFQTSGTWTRSVYLRDCTIDGNFRHNAGTAAGASGYIVIDGLLGAGNSSMYHSVLTGTVEYRNPSNSLASILQTGGIVLINNASTGITANGATTSALFGGTGFSYKGTAAAAGAGTVYFQGGSNQGTGKVDIGANVIYGWTNLTIDPANLTVSGSAIAYTTAVPAAANAQAITQQRPRLDLLKTTSSVTAANQLGTVIDSATGAIYSVAALDAGTY